MTALDSLESGKRLVEAVELWSALKKQQWLGNAPSLGGDQRKVLRGFTGFGPVATKLFRDPVKGTFPTSGWTRLGIRLEEALSLEELESARSTTYSAFYTSFDVMSHLYTGLRRVGIRYGARGLEPGCGVGNFVEMGTDCGYEMVGVERDVVSGGIAALLNPEAEIVMSPLQRTDFEPESFDFAIGNVPFGDIKIPLGDGRYSLHNYFILKSLDLVRPGGAVAVVSSRYTLDSKDIRARMALHEKAELLGAVRLPNGAFKEQGTDVIADILFFRKWQEDEPRPDKLPIWIHSDPMDFRGGSTPVNNFFREHPDQMLGSPSLRSGRHGPTLHIQADGELREGLERSLKLLPPRVCREDFGLSAIRKKKRTRDPSLPEHLVEGSFLVDQKDRIAQVVDGQAELVTYSGRVLETKKSKHGRRLAGLIQIRDTAREVLRLQNVGVQDEQVKEAARASLRAAYDAFNKEFGPINLTTLSESKSGKVIRRQPNLTLFRRDPEGFFVRALEKYDERTHTGTGAEIMYRDVIGRPKVAMVSDAKDALLHCLNEKGRVDPERIAALASIPVSQVETELEGLIFFDPSQRGFVTADRYLSGDIREKLEALDSWPDPRASKNREALEARMPKRLKADEIYVGLGAPWIPTNVVQEFLAEITHAEAHRFEVAFDPIEGLWTVKTDRVTARASLVAKWGTSRFSGVELVHKALNLQLPVVRDKAGTDEEGRAIYKVNQGATMLAREKQEALNKHFASWVFSKPDREKQLVGIYNETFNTLRIGKYDGSHLTFPGMSQEIRLRAYQADAVWRILCPDNTLLAMKVGFGKTFIMVAASMESRRLGLASKPLHVVKDNTLHQYGKDFLRLYPNARVLVVENEDDLIKSLVVDYDAVVISHTGFFRLPMSPAFQVAFIAKEIRDYEDMLKGDGRPDKGNIQKRLAKLKDQRRELLSGKASKNKSKHGLAFDQLGFDMVFLDESDVVKNLGIATKMRNVRGIQTGESNRAFDMYMKSRYLNEISGNRGLVFASGTPISNTMGEAYVLMKLLAPDELKRRKIYHFDSWAATFGRVVTGLELGVDGRSLKMRSRFSEFINVPELLTLYRGGFAEVKSPTSLKLPVPELEGGKAEVVVAPMSPHQTRLMDELVLEYEELQSGESKDKSPAAYLMLLRRGRSLAADARLLEPSAPYSSDGKIGLLVDKVQSIWESTHDTKSTQLVFCDFGVHPKDWGFSVYGEIQRRLIEAGIPQDQVAAIGSANSSNKREALFEKVRRGDIRILLGSTEKMGTGTNVQDRLYALHEFDAPFRPRDVEQRVGRIVRPGNMHKKVRLLRYVTEGSTDALIWQILESKTRFVTFGLAEDFNDRVVKDLGQVDIGYQEIKALASGSLSLQVFAEVESERRRLASLRTGYGEERQRIQSRIRSLPHEIKRAEGRLEKLRTALDTRVSTRGNAFRFEMVGGQIFSKQKGEKETARRRAARAVHKLIVRSTDKDVFGDLRIKKGTELPMLVGRLGGVDLSIKSSYRGKVNLGVGSAGVSEVSLADAKLGETFLNTAERWLSKLDSEVARQSAMLQRLKEERTHLKAMPFPQEAEYQQLQAISKSMSTSFALEAEGVDRSEELKDDVARFEAWKEHRSQEPTSGSLTATLPPHESPAELLKEPKTEDRSKSPEIPETDDNLGPTIQELKPQARWDGEAEEPSRPAPASNDDEDTSKGKTRHRNSLQTRPVPSDKLSRDDGNPVELRHNRRLQRVELRFREDRLPDLEVRRRMKALMFQRVPGVWYRGLDQKGIRAAEEVRDLCLEIQSRETSVVRPQTSGAGLDTGLDPQLDSGTIRVEAEELHRVLSEKLQQLQGRRSSFEAEAKEAEHLGRLVEWTRLDLSLVNGSDRTLTIEGIGSFDLEGGQEEQKQAVRALNVMSREAAAGRDEWKRAEVSGLELKFVESTDPGYWNLSWGHSSRTLGIEPKIGPWAKPVLGIIQREIASLDSQLQKRSIRLDRYQRDLESVPALLEQVRRVEGALSALEEVRDRLASSGNSTADVQGAFETWKSAHSALLIKVKGETLPATENPEHSATSRKEESGKALPSETAVVDRQGEGSSSSAADPLVVSDTPQSLERIEGRGYSIESDPRSNAIELKLSFERDPQVDWVLKRLGFSQHSTGWRMTIQESDEAVRQATLLLKTCALRDELRARIWDLGSVRRRLRGVESTAQELGPMLQDLSRLTPGLLPLLQDRSRTAPAGPIWLDIEGQSYSLGGTEVANSAVQALRKHWGDVTAGRREWGEITVAGLPLEFSRPPAGEEWSQVAWMARLGSSDMLMPVPDAEAIRPLLFANLVSIRRLWSKVETSAWSLQELQKTIRSDRTVDEKRSLTEGPLSDLKDLCREIEGRNDPSSLGRVLFGDGVPSSTELNLEELSAPLEDWTRRFEAWKTQADQLVASSKRERIPRAPARKSLTSLQVMGQDYDLGDDTGTRAEAGFALETAVQVLAGSPRQEDYWVEDLGGIEIRFSKTGNKDGKPSIEGFLGKDPAIPLGEIDSRAAWAESFFFRARTEIASHLGSQEELFVESVEPENQGAVEPELESVLDRLVAFEARVDALLDTDNEAVAKLKGLPSRVELKAIQRDLANRSDTALISLKIGQDDHPVHSERERQRVGRMLELRVLEAHREDSLDSLTVQLRNLDLRLIADGSGFRFILGSSIGYLGWFEHQTSFGSRVIESGLQRIEALDRRSEEVNRLLIEAEAINASRFGQGKLSRIRNIRERVALLRDRIDQGELDSEGAIKILERTELLFSDWGLDRLNSDAITGSDSTLEDPPKGNRPENQPLTVGGQSIRKPRTESSLPPLIEEEPSALDAHGVVAVDKPVLKPETPSVEPNPRTDGFRIVHNTEINRVQIFFDEKPPRQVREKIGRQGLRFRWARSTNAWHRVLNDKGIEAGKAAGVWLGVWALGNEITLRQAGRDRLVKWRNEIQIQIELASRGDFDDGLGHPSDGMAEWLRFLKSEAPEEVSRIDGVVEHFSALEGLNQRVPTFLVEERPDSSTADELASDFDQWRLGLDEMVSGLDPVSRAELDGDKTAVVSVTEPEQGVAPSVERGLLADSHAPLSPSSVDPLSSSAAQESGIPKIERPVVEPDPAKDDVTFWQNQKLGRVQIRLKEEDPPKEVKDKLRSLKFNHAPSQGVWQRAADLDGQALRAAEQAREWILNRRDELEQGVGYSFWDGHGRVGFQFKARPSTAIVDRLEEDGFLSVGDSNSWALPSYQAERETAQKVRDWLDERLSAWEESQTQSERAGAPDRTIDSQGGSIDLNKAIRSDDPEAIAKLEAKLKRLAHDKTRMQLVNEVWATYRKNRAQGEYLMDQQGLSPEERRTVTTSTSNDFRNKPYPGFRFRNLDQEARRVRDRLLKLKELEAKLEEADSEVSIEGRGFKVVHNRELRRVQLIFDSKPPQQVREKLGKRGLGFRWAPSKNAWQRLLNENGIEAGKDAAVWLGVFGLLQEMDDQRSALHRVKAWSGEIETELKAAGRGEIPESEWSQESPGSFGNKGTREVLMIQEVAEHFAQLRDLESKARSFLADRWADSSRAEALSQELDEWRAGLDERLDRLDDQSRLRFHGNRPPALGETPSSVERAETEMAPELSTGPLPSPELVDSSTAQQVEENAVPEAPRQETPAPQAPEEDSIRKTLDTGLNEAGRLKPALEQHRRVQAEKLERLSELARILSDLRQGAEAMRLDLAQVQPSNEAVLTIEGSVQFDLSESANEREKAYRALETAIRKQVDFAGLRMSFRHLKRNHILEVRLGNSGSPRVVDLTQADWAEDVLREARTHVADLGKSLETRMDMIAGRERMQQEVPKVEERQATVDKLLSDLFRLEEDTRRLLTGAGADIERQREAVTRVERWTADASGFLETDPDRLSNNQALFESPQTANVEARRPDADRSHEAPEHPRVANNGADRSNVWVEGTHYTIIRNEEARRVQIRFKDEPPQTVEKRLRKRDLGFRWSRREDAWGRTLDEAGIDAGKQAGHWLDLWQLGSEVRPTYTRLRSELPLLRRRISDGKRGLSRGQAWPEKTVQLAAIEDKIRGLGNVEQWVGIMLDETPVNGPRIQQGIASFETWKKELAESVSALDARTRSEFPELSSEVSTAKDRIVEVPGEPMESLPLPEDLPETSRPKEPARDLPSSPESPRTHEIEGIGYRVSHASDVGQIRIEFDEVPPKEVGRMLGRRRRDGFGFSKVPGVESKVWGRKLDEAGARAGDQAHRWLELWTLKQEIASTLGRLEPYLEWSQWNRTGDEGPLERHIEALLEISSKVRRHSEFGHSEPEFLDELVSGFEQWQRRLTEVVEGLDDLSRQRFVESRGDSVETCLFEDMESARGLIILKRNALARRSRNLTQRLPGEVERLQKKIEAMEMDCSLLKGPPFRLTVGGVGSFDLSREDGSRSNALMALSEMVKEAAAGRADWREVDLSGLKVTFSHGEGTSWRLNCGHSLQGLVIETSPASWQEPWVGPTLAYLEGELTGLETELSESRRSLDKLAIELESTPMVSSELELSETNLAALKALSETVSSSNLAELRSRFLAWQQTERVSKSLIEVLCFAETSLLCWLSDQIEIQRKTVGNVLRWTEVVAALDPEPRASLSRQLGIDRDADIDQLVEELDRHLTDFDELENSVRIGLSQTTPYLGPVMNMVGSYTAQEERLNELLGSLDPNRNELKTTRVEKLSEMQLGDTVRIDGAIGVVAFVGQDRPPWTHDSVVEVQIGGPHPLKYSLSEADFEAEGHTLDVWKVDLPVVENTTRQSPHLAVEKESTHTVDPPRSLEAQSNSPSLPVPVQSGESWKAAAQEPRLALNSRVFYTLSELGRWATDPKVESEERQARRYVFEIRRELSEKFVPLEDRIRDLIYYRPNTPTVPWDPFEIQTETRALGDFLSDKLIPESDRRWLIEGWVRQVGLKKDLTDQRLLHAGLRVLDPELHQPVYHLLRAGISGKAGTQWAKNVAKKIPKETLRLIRRWVRSDGWFTDIDVGLRRVERSLRVMRRPKQTTLDFGI